MTLSNRKRTLAGIALLIFALYLGGLGFFYHRLPAESLHAPRWIFYVLAFLLSAAAGLAFLGEDHPVSNLLAALVWLSFAGVGAWAALFSSLDNLTGGFSMLPNEVNRMLARLVFGLGAILNLGVGFYSGWRYFRQEDR